MTTALTPRSPCACFFFEGFSCLSQPVVHAASWNITHKVRYFENRNTSFRFFTRPVAVAVAASMVVAMVWILSATCLLWTRRRFHTMNN